MMVRITPIIVIAFILTGALLCSCDSKITDNPCDTCGTPCDTCIPCDTCDTTTPCDTCDTTRPTPLDTTSHDFIWSEYTIPSEVSITGCAVFGDNNIYAIGTYLYKFDGATWTKIPVKQEGTGRSLSFPDFKMFGFSPNDVWIFSGGIIDHYIGDGVAKEYRPAFEFGKGVLSCWGLSSDDLFFVGYQGSIYHFDGKIFSKFPQVTTKNIRSVSGTTHTDVWASGFSSSTAETVLLHYDGNAWTEDPISIEKGLYATGGFNGVWACDSAGKTFVTTSGAILIRKTGDGIWRSDSNLIPNRLLDGTFVGINPFGNSPNDMFSIGSWGFVAHWNGKNWKKYDELYNYGNPNYGPACFNVKGNTACVGGTKSGKSWIAIGRRK